MTDHHLRIRACLHAFAYCGLLGCSGSGISEDVGIEQQEIINGSQMSQGQVNFYGLVAVYSPGPGFPPPRFFPRPCSGTILATGPTGTSVVLTARHCLTVDGSINGTVVSPGTVRLIATAQPGIANPNPPSGPDTFTPFFISPSPIDPSIDLVASDLALIYVAANWSSHVTSRLGFWVGGPDTPFQIDNAYGYGINVTNWTCLNNGSVTTGAGIARFAVTLGAKTAAADRNAGFWEYAVRQPNGANQSVTCGDSGGSDVANLAFNDDASLEHIAGVHSQAGPAQEVSAGASLWLERQLGGLFLSPLRNSHTFNLNRPLNSHTVSLLSNVSPATGWIYDWRNNTIYDPIQEDIGQDWCVDVSGSSIVANLCNGASSQKWFLDAFMKIHNASRTGNCLTAPASGTSPIVVTTCSNLPLTQGWAFHVPL